MIKLNKDSNSPKMERASAPGVKVKKYNIKGIITIEAALAVPLFLFAVICLIYLIEVRNIRLVLHNASQSAAKETVEDLAVLPVFNSVKMQQKIIKNIGEERLERSLLDGGTSAISCWKSYYDIKYTPIITFPTRPPYFIYFSDSFPQFLNALALPLFSSSYIDF